MRILRCVYFGKAASVQPSSWPLDFWVFCALVVEGTCGRNAASKRTDVSRGEFMLRVSAEDMLCNCWYFDDKFSYECRASSCLCTNKHGSASFLFVLLGRGQLQSGVRLS